MVVRIEFCSLRIELSHTLLRAANLSISGHYRRDGSWDNCRFSSEHVNQMHYAINVNNNNKYMLEAQWPYSQSSIPVGAMEYMSF